MWIGGDGRISAVAPAGELTEHNGCSAGSARTLPADGRVLTSGLWDEHVHLGQWAQQSGRPDFGNAHSPEQALALAASCIDRHAIAGTSGHETQTELIGVRLRGGDWGGLTLAQLDSVSADIPIVLIGIDLHGAWLNTAALRRHRLPLDRGSHVVEEECFALVAELDRVSDEQLDASIASSSRRAASLGVVGVVDFEMRWGHDDWVRREATARSAIRVESAVYPQHLDRAIVEGLVSGSLIGNSGRVSVGPLKVITDGSLGTRTAFCCEQYPGGGFGRQLVPPEALAELLGRATRNAFAVAVHAIGDHANSQALDAFETTGARGRIEHAQLLRPQDIPRFSALNVAASMQPAHLLDDLTSMEAAWGARARDAFPIGSLLRHGARVVFGSDAPVSALNPWQAIAVAVGRSRAGGSPWGSDERLSLTQALACSMRGSLHPGVGDIADLVLLGSDPLANEALLAGQINGETPSVEATLLEGYPTHLSFAQ